MEMAVRQFTSREGRTPFAIWFDGLDRTAAAKVRTALARLQHGNVSHVKSVGAGVLELMEEQRMALTKDFSETVRERAGRDAGFRRALLREAIECLLAGDIGTGKIVLRDYINATIGFERLGAATNISPKSLMRMVGPHGNPQARNLFDVIGHLQRVEGVQVRVSLKANARRPAA